MSAHINITWSPVFWLDLTAEEVDLLMKLSARHYDGYCKSISQPGHFLYGWSNRVKWRDEAMQAGPLPHARPSTCRASPDDLTILMKIMECAPEWAELSRLQVAIASALRNTGVWS